MYVYYSNNLPLSLQSGVPGQSKTEQSSPPNPALHTHVDVLPILGTIIIRTVIVTVWSPWTE